MSPIATPATRNEGGFHQVPCLPCKTKVHVAKCHPCHAKYRGVTGDQSGPKRAQARHQVQQVSRLPRKTKVDVTKCHACHEKRRWMSPGATPATQNEGTCRQVPRLPRKVPRRHRRPIRAKARPSAPPSATSATPATPNEGGCHQMPRLPRETKVHVAKCHACHARRRWMSPNATPAT